MKITPSALLVFLVGLSAAPLAGCFSDYGTDCSRNPALDCFWGKGGTGGGGTGGGTTTSTTDTTTSVGPECGDGNVDSTEACDDGNTTDCDGCRGDCSAKETGCGDGFLCPPEQCDEGDANSDAGTCTLSCRIPSCGDNILQPGEECDDGNTTSGDNCSKTCKVECAPGAYEGTVFRDVAVNHCYLLVPALKRTWSGAQNECKLWNAKADLVGFTGATEVTTVSAQLPVTAKTWTGGNNNDTYPAFVWSNGEPFPIAPSMWAGGQPSLELDQRCVAFDKNYLLSDEKCATLQGFLCELDMGLLQ
ncbi:MAG: DUF4215 domain-containing protein [Polyangiaceae bacterium]